MAVHSIIYTAFTAFAVYILIHFTAVSLFNKNGEYTGLHNGQIAQKLQREYRRLWFMVFHYHPQLVKDGVGIRLSDNSSEVLFSSKVIIGRSRAVPMNPPRHDFFDPLIKIFKMNLFVVAGTMYLTIVNVSDHSDTFK